MARQSDATVLFTERLAIVHASASALAAVDRPDGSFPARRLRRRTLMFARLAKLAQFRT